MSQKEEVVNRLQGELLAVQTELDEVKTALAEMEARVDDDDTRTIYDGDSDSDIYPDIQLGDDAEQFIPVATNPFDDDSSQEQEKAATNPFEEEWNGLNEDDCSLEEAAANPSGEGSSEEEERVGFKSEHEEISILNARVVELEVLNDELTQQLSSLKLEHDTRDDAAWDATIEEVEHLKHQVTELEKSNEALREELMVADKVHASDSEAIACLQMAIDDQRGVIDGWKSQVEDLQKAHDSLAEELSNMQSAANDGSDCAVLPQSPAEDGAPDQQTSDLIASLKDQVSELEEANASMSAQLASSQDIALLEQEIQELTAKLVQSEAKVAEAAMVQENAGIAQRQSLQQALGDREKLQVDMDALRSSLAEADQACQRDRDTIASLERELNDKEVQLHEKLQQALNDQESRHQNELRTWKAKVTELRESNVDLNRRISDLMVQASDHTECKEKHASIEMELQNARNDVEEKNAEVVTAKKQLDSLQADLQSARNDREEVMIQHNLELATVNAEFHNAMVSLDEMSIENRRLKSELERLASKETVEDRNFEKEMNAAHARFESMEKALQEKIGRLQREKDKLVSDFNLEITKKEDELTQSRVELSAWKLEMQNAINDIESLKRERDDLKAQVESYVSGV